MMWRRRARLLLSALLAVVLVVLAPSVSWAEPRADVPQQWPAPGRYTVYDVTLQNFDDANWRYMYADGPNDPKPAPAEYRCVREAKREISAYVDRCPQYSATGVGAPAPSSTTSTAAPTSSTTSAPSSTTSAPTTSTTASPTTSPATPGTTSPSASPSASTSTSASPAGTSTSSAGTAVSCGSVETPCVMTLSASSLGDLGAPLLALLVTSGALLVVAVRR